ncbi:hypothetical protein CA11_26220 [Gimesia maris]|uniref:hypothetical protein n=1 Tax=Gimesia maris TaxID=122 RepID=UPI00118BDDC6|nr:hypothetical protein [Gimesia maris]QDU14811.1 hypothetical protein CA11_26220 [Gimesia maris]
MNYLSGRLNDVKTVWQLLASRIEGQTHVERLNSFYQGQAAGYDQFRKRLLHGRCELFESLAVPENGVWVEWHCRCFFALSMRNGSHVTSSHA